MMFVTERSHESRVVGLAQAECLSVVDYFCWFVAGWDGAFGAVFLAEDFFNFYRNVA